MYRLAHCLFDMESDKIYAARKLALSKITDTTDDISDVSVCNTNMNDNRKVAYNISVRFKKSQILREHW